MARNIFLLVRATGGGDLRHDPAAGSTARAGTRPRSGSGAAARGLADPRRILAWLLIAVLIGVAAWLRIGDTLARPLWIDEGYSAYIADKDFAWIWRVVPRFETHPPFYYSILRVWTLLFGDALAARRALGILAGLATLPATALAMAEIGRLLGWRRERMLAAAAMATGLVALSPLMIEMSRQVRPYPVLILVHALALAALFRVGRIAREERRIAPAPLAAYLAALATLLWLHNLAILSGAALGLASLALLGGCGLARRDWLVFWAGHALVALAYLPAFAILVDQAQGWTASTWLKFDPATLGWDFSRLLATSGRPGLVLVLLLGMSGIVALARRTDGRRVAVALLLTALLPAALSIAVSLFLSPIFLPRTLSAATVPAALMIAIGAAAAEGGWRWPMRLALLAVVALTLRTDLHEYGQRPKQDWYGTAAWLSARIRPGDEVWTYPNDVALPLHYAAFDRGDDRLMAALRPQPTPVPTLDAGPGAAYPTGNRGAVTLSPARLRALADAPAARRVATIWLVRLRANLYDADGAFAAALARGRTAAAACRSDPIDVIGFAHAGTIPPSAGPEAPCRPASGVSPPR